MPNWCHCTLTVKGDKEPVQAFVERVKESDEQPLTFAAHVPEPTAEEYEAMEEAWMSICKYCAGTGYRPRTQEEADALGTPFWEGVIEIVADEERKACNGCKYSDKPWDPGIPGRGMSTDGRDAWYEWRLANWGVKWDASFGEPFIAFGVEEADVDLSVALKGETNTLDVPTTTTEAGEVAIYKFDTPWGPPVEWLEKASEVEPELEFELEYGEMGMEFAGRQRYVSGLCIEDVALEIDEVLAPEEQWF